jgi:hypothetical protein
MAVVAHHGWWWTKGKIYPKGGEERGDILRGNEERAWHGMDCPSHVCI